MKKLIHRIKEKWGEKGFQKYFRNTGWMFVGQFSMIISLVINIWLARYFGPEKYGIINYVLAFVGIFGFIANLGINEILIRELVKFPEKRNKLLGTSFLLLALSGILAFLISLITVFIYEDNNLIRTLIILYSTIFLLSPLNIIASYFQATLQAKKNALAQIIGTILVSLFKVFLILSGKGVIWIIFAFILDYIIGAILYILNYLRSDLNIFEWRFDKEIIKQFISASFLLMLSSATGYLLLKIDQVMIGNYLQEKSVGIYAAAVKLTEIWYFVPLIISSSLFPAIINAKTLSKELYYNRLKKLFIFLFSIAILIAIPTTFLSTLIIKIVYGSEYLQSVQILQIYIWSSIGFFMTIGINKYLIVENKLKSIFLYNLFSAMLNIVLNMILIPKIGISGSAWATLISYSISPVIVFIIYKFKKNKDENKK
jgi:O-antigen/teichoic acid export membrane protein